MSGFPTHMHFGQVFSSVFLWKNGKYTGPPGGPARPNASSIAESNPSLVRPGFLALAVYVSSQ